MQHGLDVPREHVRLVSGIDGGDVALKFDLPDAKSRSSCCVSSCSYRPCSMRIPSLRRCELVTFAAV